MFLKLLVFISLLPWLFSEKVISRISVTLSLIALLPALVFRLCWTWDLVWKGIGMSTFFFFSGLCVCLECSLFLLYC